MTDPDYSASLPADFQNAATADSQAAPATETVSLTVPIGVAEWFKGSMQPTDWRHHMAEVLQFYMETNQPSADRALDPEPGQAPIIGR